MNTANSSKTKNLFTELKKGFFHSVSFPIAIFVYLVFTVLVVIIAIISIRMNEKLYTIVCSDFSISNTYEATLMIDGDLIENFVENKVASPDYVEFSTLMTHLSKNRNVKFFYILAEIGDSDNYMYIYDSQYSNENNGAYALGIFEAKSVFPGSAEVIENGMGFEKAVYYKDENYGELYYSYAPIFNSSGDIVAFVGTDIDVSSFSTKVNQYKTQIILITTFISGGFVVLLFVLLNKFLAKPLENLAKNAEKLSNGDLNLDVLNKSVLRLDEIGQVAKGFLQMSTSVNSLIESNKEILKAVRDGKLSERVDLLRFRGDYNKIMVAMNDSLDVICTHFDSLPESIGFFDSDYLFVYKNSKLDKFIFDFGFEDKDHKLLSKILSSGAMSNFDDEVLEYYQSDNTISFSRTIEFLSFDDDKPKTFELMLFKISGAAEGIDINKYNLMMTITDITLLTDSKNDALSASKAKSEFLSHMSHEIRTPLNAIIGLTQVARRTANQEKIRDCVIKIESSSKHLLGIINDVLDLSKIEAGKLAIVEEEFSIIDNLEFVKTMMNSRANDKNINFELEIIDIKHYFIKSDSLRLNQSLMNLLSNAIKFTEKGGNVKLTAKELFSEDSMSVYQFAVSDSGIGISEENQKKLFNSFEQGDSSITRKYGGTGLGLAISKNIIELMGGTLVLKSVEGKGTEFSFTIKAKTIKALSNDFLKSKNENQSREQFIGLTGDIDSLTNPSTQTEYISPIRQKYNFTGMRALVVDDVDLNRLIIIEMLDDTGLVFEEAENGLEGLEKFLNSEKGYYSIVLMDMQMPVMDGCTAAEKIRSSDHPDAKDIPIIAMTANVFKEDIESVLKSGMDSHIGKPIDLDNTLKIISSYLIKKQ